MFDKLKKIYKFFPNKKNIGSAGANSRIEFPVYISCPKSVHMEENCLIRQGTRIIIAPTEHLYIKKYTVVGVNTTIVTNSHRSTVGIPHILLGASHVNDKSSDIHIDEDVWIGTNVTILAGASLGRGCICGACSTITKTVPPYALVTGTPAKIVGVKFTVDQIIEHEKILYPESERMSREELEKLFTEYYTDKKVFGVSTKFGDKEIAAIKDAAIQRSFIGNDLLDKLIGEDQN